MLFPIGDENPSERTPYVTWGLIALNSALFLVMATSDEAARSLSDLAYDTRHPSIVTIFGSMFLHANLMHILGNMWFLWIVGDNVEDKLGHARYLALYLGAGVFAVLFFHLFVLLGAGHAVLVGASGAISGILACYMIFFPLARIRIFYWIFFFFIGVIRVSAKWVIGIWLGLQLLEWAMVQGSRVPGAQQGGVAYAAHVGGFLVGVVVALVAKRKLALGAAPSRADAMTGFVKPPEGFRPDPARPRVTPVFENPRVQRERDADDFFGAEEAIAENVKSGLLDVAVERYLEYIRMPHAKPLPAWAQIEIAGELFRRKDYDAALEAYRRYVSNHPTGPDAAEAKFRLGIILSRHRREYFRAREYLLQAAVEHPDPEIVGFAKEELQRIEPFL